MKRNIVAFLIFALCLFQARAFDADIAIVGSGLSGLTTAYRLQQEGLSVIVLEASDTIGGRTRSIDFSNARISVGGTFAFLNNEHLLSLASEVGLKPRFHPSVGAYLPGGFFDHDELGIHLYEIVDEIKKNSKTEEDIYDHPIAKELDKVSLTQWVAKQNYSQESKKAVLDFFILVESLDEQLADTSALHAGLLLHTRLKPASFDWVLKVGYESLMELDRTYMEALWKSEIFSWTYSLLTRPTLCPFIPVQRWENGTGAFVDALVSKVGKKHIKTLTQVKSIDQDSQGVTIHTSEGKIIKSKYAVVAASPRGASRIQISSEGTTNFLPLTTPVGFSGFNILFAYEQQFWHGEPFDIGTASEKADSLLGPSQIMDLTPFDKTKPGLIRLITSPERVEAASEEEIVKKSLQHTIKFHPHLANQIKNYTEAKIFNWRRENPFIDPGLVYKPGVLTKHGKNLMKPLGRIYFAGSERTPEGMNWMEGAVRSGDQVASKIVSTVTNKPKQELFARIRSSAGKIELPLIGILAITAVECYSGLMHFYLLVVTKKQLRITAEGATLWTFFSMEAVTDLIILFFMPTHITGGMFPRIMYLAHFGLHVCLFTTSILAQDLLRWIARQKVTEWDPNMLLMLFRLIVTSGLVFDVLTHVMTCVLVLQTNLPFLWPALSVGAACSLAKQIYMLHDKAALAKLE